MAMAKKRLGKTDCPDCGTESWVKESESGTLSFTCPDCDYSVLLRKGTPACEKLRAKLTTPAPEPSPENDPAQNPEPTPRPAKKRGFDLGL